jgi:hypothetical protein
MHQINVKLATKYGVNQSILLEHLWWWHKKNIKSKGSLIDGRIWSYNTYATYHEIFPYLSIRQIRLAFDRLEEMGLIVTGNYNKFKFDKTKWYALTDLGLFIFNDKPKKPFVKSSRFNDKSNRHVDKPVGHNDKAIPDPKPDHIPNNKTNNRPDLNSYCDDLSRAREEAI